ARGVGCVGGRGGKRAVSGLQRILGESRQYVGQEQLLMLLLMLNAEFDERQCFGRQVGQWGLKPLVDFPPARTDLIQAWAAKHSAPRTGVPLALAVVIAVEQEGPALVVEPVAGHMIAQDE